jgi:hypothetical protein
MAITAVAADFFRRSVVVDIINWPVLYIFYIAGFPAGLRQWSQTLSVRFRLYKLSPSLQTAHSPTGRRFLPCVASLSRSRGLKTCAKVNMIIQFGEQHEHRHDGESDPKADFLGFFA